MPTDTLLGDITSRLSRLEQDVTDFRLSVTENALVQTFISRDPATRKQLVEIEAQIRVLNAELVE